MDVRRSLAVMAGCVLMAAPLGVPAAAGDQAINQIRGTGARDHLTGTNRADVIHGLDGNDRIRPRAGADRVRAGRGNDTIFLSRDGKVDRIVCGPGFDVIVWKVRPDPRDRIDPSCEGQIA